MACARADAECDEGARSPCQKRRKTATKRRATHAAASQPSTGKRNGRWTMRESTMAARGAAGNKPICEPFHYPLAGVPVRFVRMRVVGQGAVGLGGVRMMVCALDVVMLLHPDADRTRTVNSKWGREYIRMSVPSCQGAYATVPGQSGRCYLLSGLGLDALIRCMMARCKCSTRAHVLAFTRSDLYRRLRDLLGAREDETALAHDGGTPAECGGRGADIPRATCTQDGTQHEGAQCGGGRGGGGRAQPDNPPHTEERTRAMHQTTTEKAQHSDSDMPRANSVADSANEDIEPMRALLAWLDKNILTAEEDQHPTWQDADVPGGCDAPHGTRHAVQCVATHTYALSCAPPSSSLSSSSSSYTRAPLAWAGAPSDTRAQTHDVSADAFAQWAAMLDHEQTRTREAHARADRAERDAVHAMAVQEAMGVRVFALQTELAALCQRMAEVERIRKRDTERWEIERSQQQCRIELLSAALANAQAALGSQRAAAVAPADEEGKRAGRLDPELGAARSCAPDAPHDVDLLRAHLPPLPQDEHEAGKAAALLRDTERDAQHARIARSHDELAATPACALEGQQSPETCQSDGIEQRAARTALHDQVA